MENLHKQDDNMNSSKPTTAYVGATWGVFLIGVIAYLFGLWNAETMQLNERGYYFAVLAFGLYASISLQKTVRDQQEGIPTSRLYYLVSWVALATAVSLLIIGLYNATLSLSEKGFYLMAYTMSVFASITIQKNIRDTTNFNALYDSEMAQLTHQKNTPLENTQLESTHMEKSISSRIFKKQD